MARKMKKTEREPTDHFTMMHFMAGKPHLRRGRIS